MPEGHTIHRLAETFTEAFGGRRVRTSSPQGRFPEAAELDRWVLGTVEAAGKHLFLGFAPEPDAPALRFVHVHLGLYGSWTFSVIEGSARALELPAAIGAPRVAVSAAVPGPTVRLRVQGSDALADLTGPTACELLDDAGRRRILERLGPDPLREDADPQRFVDRVRRSRSVIGTQLMDQSVIAGIGNIYRAEALFRARLDPWVPGKDLSPGMVRGIWDDLVPLLEHGRRTGRIVTTQPEHRELHAGVLERSRGARQNGDGNTDVIPREQSFYVYHRQTLPCRLCETPIRSVEMAARTVFWCPRCQRVRSRRADFTTRHPARGWAA